MEGRKITKLTANSIIEFKDFSLDFNMNVDSTSITALFGPSGHGKTSILNWLSGLLTVPGSIQFADKLWQGENFSLPARERQIGYVFQDCKIFNHLSVQANLDFALPYRSKDAKNMNRQECIQELSLDKIMNKKTAGLSGGERQRLALGRALMRGPSLLLLDEPLSAIDMKQRAKIITYLKKINHEYMIPIIIVTHSISEVLKLADSVICIESGKTRESISISQFKSEYSQFL